MALVTIYGRGKIEDVETTLKKHRQLTPRPGLLTSFSNRAGALILGVFLIVLGLACAWILIKEHTTLFEKVVLVIGALSGFVGLWMAWKALFAFDKAALPHKYFYYDEARIVMGTTNPIDQAAIKSILRTPKAERIKALTAASPGFTEIAVQAVERVDLHVEKVQLHADKLKIMGGGKEILVDFDALLPSLNFSGINGDFAFNSISQYYTQATGKTLTASIEKF